MEKEEYSGVVMEALEDNYEAGEDSIRYEITEKIGVLSTDSFGLGLLVVCLWS